MKAVNKQILNFPFVETLVASCIHLAGTSLNMQPYIYLLPSSLLIQVTKNKIKMPRTFSLQAIDSEVCNFKSVVVLP